MNVLDSRINKLEKTLGRGNSFVYVWGRLLPTSKLKTEEDRTKMLILAARGILPSTPRPAGVPSYSDLYPLPLYIKLICERAKKITDLSQAKMRTGSDED